MRVLVTGAGGMLARALASELAARGHEVVALTRSQLDVTHGAAVDAAIRDVRPKAVVQGAAYTNVDGAEADEAAASEVNARATDLLAAACHRSGASLVYPSSDYVFDGEGRRPYLPGDPPRPLNAYGRTKLAGERAAERAGEFLVVRTSWLYGSGGKHFVDTIARLAAERDRLEVVDDQIGRPTWTGSLARATAELMERGARGIFHATDAGPPVSWHGFAARILELQGIETQLVPVPSSRFPRPAARPRYSVLELRETETLLGRSLPPWEESLTSFLASGVSTAE